MRAALATQRERKEGQEETMESGINSIEACGPEARYFERLSQGVFEIQRCCECSQHIFFPRALCPHCGSESADWVQPSGRGKVYSFSIVRRKAEAGGDYNVVLVNLEEGVRIMSRIANLDGAEVRIGQRVQARVEMLEGKGVLVFDAVENGHA